jgi:16S rRNA (cytidine1402-2'-O)-methyltransferase
MKGKLYIVSTPIGNLEDITNRAVRTLKEVDIIACEDTRVTKKLLNYLSVTKPLQSYHEHNETEKSIEVVNELLKGKNIALVSDAGTPGISDPGYRLIKLASESGIEVLTIPGPCAAISALSISGLPTSSFTFIGFAPRTEKKRKDFLEEIKNYPQTNIFYESPYRALKTLKSIQQVFGDRNCSVSRELTKIYEETIRGKLSEVISILEKKEKIKGEFTIVVEGHNTNFSNTQIDIEPELIKLKKQGKSLKEAVKEICGIYKAQKNEVYKTALKIWS